MGRYSSHFAHSLPRQLIFKYCSYDTDIGSGSVAKFYRQSFEMCTEIEGPLFATAHSTVFSLCQIEQKCALSAAHSTRLQYNNASSSETRYFITLEEFTVPKRVERRGMDGIIIKLNSRYVDSRSSP